jgi:phosphohistidine phosphatase
VYQCVKENDCSLLMCVQRFAEGESMITFGHLFYFDFMKKTIFLVRHAKSDWSVPTPTDFERPLNARGQRDAPVMAAVMRDAGVQPDLIVSSTATRALTTARVFQSILEVAQDQFILEDRIYEASPQTILQIIWSLPVHVNTVCLFGHNMTFSQLKQHFDPDKHDNVPTCGIVQISGEVDSWEAFNYPNASCISMWTPKDAEY